MANNKQALTPPSSAMGENSDNEAGAESPNDNGQLSNMTTSDNPKALENIHRNVLRR